MAAQKLDLQLRGLFTSPNNLSAVPAGALEVADNVVLNTKSIISSRRGQTQYGDPVTVGSGQLNKLFNYSSSLILSYDNKLAYDAGDGDWTDYSGTYVDPATGYRMRSLEALRNFYFTTDRGVYKLDQITGTPRASGVVKALGGTGSLTGASGFLDDDSAVAYRLVWGYTDANNNLLLGAPSQRLVVINSSGGTRDVSLTYVIPDTITTEYFYQIYRSNGSDTAAIEPSDELQLVLQGNPTSAEITAKSFTVTDSTPYSLMRATLYTSASEQGIANANYEPPFALDMDLFKGFAFYANITQKQRLELSMISVESPSLGYYVDGTVGTTNGSPTLTAIASTTDLRVGMRIIGTGIPTNTRILAVPTGTTVTMNKNATATATVSVEFQDRFSIGEVDYWAGTTQTVATNTFKVDVSGTPAQNINQTALNLVEVINKSASNTTLYAYYLSALDDLPGKILFEERSIGGDEFFATSTAGASFSPELPDQINISSNTLANPTVVTTARAHGLTSGDIVQIFDSNSTPTIDGERVVTVISPTTFSVPVNVTVAGTSGYLVIDNDFQVSDNDQRQNRVAISKPNQAEAVPSYTNLDIGAANFPIQRVIALRDGIFFFKQDGVFRVSGESYSSFTVTLIDNTVSLKVPESAVAFNNQVFCFTTQGICAVTDSGVQIMSVPIEDALLELSSDQFTNFASASFGVAYESARLYLFFTVTETDDTFATQAYVYNSLTESWTRWQMSRTCGVVSPTLDKLFMGQGDSGQVVVERKSYTNSDYADEQYDVDITLVDSDTVMTLVDASDVQAGMTIVQSGNRAVILSKNLTNQITVASTSGFEVDDAIVYTPIENLIQWAPIDVDNPGILKQFSEVTLFFRNAAFREIDATFASNISIGLETVPITNRSTTGWGQPQWGRFPWGSPLGGQSAIRTYVPRDKQRASWLTLRLRTEEAFTGFSLQGVSVIYNPMSSRFR